MRRGDAVCCASDTQGTERAANAKHAASADANVRRPDRGVIESPIQQRAVWERFIQIVRDMQRSKKEAARVIFGT